MAEEIEVLVKYYNIIRDAAGRREERLRLPPGATLLDLLRLIAARYPAVGSILFLAGGSISPYTRLFVNGQVIEAHGIERSLAAGDEIMLFPAVAGG